MSRTLLDISNDGVVTFIWDDDLGPALLDEGAGQIRRASNVEPTPSGQQWVVDLSPSGGPTIGPFRRRGDAIAEEIEWLEANALGAR